MFKVIYKPDYRESVHTVYAVDFDRDAFLIALVNGKFKWVRMEYCRLYEGEESNGKKI